MLVPADYAPLPLTKVETPSTQDEVAALLRASHGSSTPVYPIGGGTSLDFGLVPKQSGLGLVTTKLSQVIDFPARDLTVTVEAGITIAALNEVLAQEKLWLPIDAPQADRATLGGVIASAWSGSRRYGYGLMRDYVIGIRAVDGQGNVFNGGGRVVKNVAGYDFCKLLTGSHGSLGVITQATLKLRPVAEHSALILAQLDSLDVADQLLTALSKTDAAPVAIDLLVGEAWEHEAAPSPLTLVCGLEGTEAEAQWLTSQLCDLLAGSTSRPLRVVTEHHARLWRWLADLAVAGNSALTIKAVVKPSAVTSFIHKVLEVEPSAKVQTHAASGIIYARFAEFPKAGLARTVIAKLQPLAAQSAGHLVVLSNPSGQEATLQSTFGPPGLANTLMSEVKRQFDPRNILNPGRFAFG